jgi:hypothetical protein
MYFMHDSLPSSRTPLTIKPVQAIPRLDEWYMVCPGGSGLAWKGITTRGNASEVGAEGIVTTAAILACGFSPVWINKQEKFIDILCSQNEWDVAHMVGMVTPASRFWLDCAMYHVHFPKRWPTIA